MIVAIVIALLAVAGGTLITYLYDEPSSLCSRLFSGAAIGFAILALAGFIFASLVGLTLLVLVLAAATLAAPFLLLLKAGIRAKVRADVEESRESLPRAFVSSPLRVVGFAVAYLLVSIAIWAVFDRAIFEHGNRIYTGVSNNYGDLPFHLSAITRFVYGNNFPPEDPTFAGARFTYPFLADFIAAMFARAGASLRGAMLIENLVLALALVGLLYRWGSELTSDRLAALLTPALILLNGGLGWWFLLRDARQTELGIFPLLAQLPHDYTIVDGNWRWGNAVTSLLVTQRSILLGLPLAIIVFTQWWRADEDRTKPIPNSSRSQMPLSPSIKRMIGAGVIAGMLPLAHGHSFVVVMIIGACLALISRRWREWTVFFGIALIIAAPQLWWVTRGSAVRVGSFFDWHFGWDRGDDNFFWFWFKNTGMFIPLVIAAIAWRGRSQLVSRRWLVFYLPFTLCFIVPNLVKLAPWVWDNIKVLFYWYVASVPLVALLLARLWRGGRWQSIASVALLATLTLAGTLDVLRVVTRASEFEEFNEQAIGLAEMIKNTTSPSALILHAPVHNHPVFLTGRRSLLGYPGHAWTHGVDYAPREADIRRIYAGEPDADELIAQYGIEYVVVGPLERVSMAVNDSYFQRYANIGEVGDYRLYRTTGK